MSGLGWSKSSATGLDEACAGDLVLRAGVRRASSGGVMGEEGFAGDLAGGPVFGVSRTTLFGVALTLKERRGESATLVGGNRTGALLTGDSTGAVPVAGERVIMGSFRGDPSPGKREMRLLRRRVDRCSICVSSILTATSVCSGDPGTGMS